MPRDTPDLTVAFPDASFTARLLAGMPPDLAERLDARLLFALQQAMEPWDGVERRRGRHLRLVLPFGTWRVSIRRESGPRLRDVARRRPGLVAGAGVAAGMALALVLGLLFG